MSNLSDDALAIVLVCTSLALPRGGADVARPLTLREWNDLAKKLSSASARPASLLDSSVATAIRDLGLPDYAERVAALTARAPQAAIQVERLTGMGIWIVSRSDSTYPARLRHVLKLLAPPVLFGVGPRELLDDQGVAVVGSRGATPDDIGFAERVARAAVASRQTVISGAARGVDRAAMREAIDAGGRAVGIPADSLIAAIRDKDWRQAIHDRRLTLVTPFVPDVGFTTWRAMDRNKIVYALAQHAVVVAASAESGGTWAGAEENLRHHWVPTFVRDDPRAPDGNQALIRRGAIPVSDEHLAMVKNLATVLSDLTESSTSDPREYVDVSAPLASGTDATVTSVGDVAEPAGDDSAQPARAAASAAPDSSQASYGSAPTEFQVLSGRAADDEVDLYDVVWPHLAEFLAEGRTRDDVQNRFLLEPSQVKKWLERAVADDRIEVTSRGRRRHYRLASSRPIHLL